MGNAGERRTARLCLGADQDVRVGCLARQESDVCDAAPGGECDFLSGIEGTPVDRSPRAARRSGRSRSSFARPETAAHPSPPRGSPWRPCRGQAHPIRPEDRQAPDAEKPPASGCWPGCSPQEPEPAKRPVVSANILSGNRLIPRKNPVPPDAKLYIKLYADAAAVGKERPDAGCDERRLESIGA